MKLNTFRLAFSNLIIALCISLVLSAKVQAGDNKIVGTWFNQSTIPAFGDQIYTAWVVLHQDKTVIVTADSTFAGVWEKVGNNQYSQKFSTVLNNDPTFPPGTILTITSIQTNDEGNASATSTDHYRFQYQGQLIYETDGTSVLQRMTLDD
jgi:hypothetical protein